MRVTVKPPAGRIQHYSFPIGLLMNPVTAGIVWGALNLSLPLSVPYRLPQTFISLLRRTTLPPGMPLAEITTADGTQIRIEL